MRRNSSSTSSHLGHDEPQRQTATTIPKEMRNKKTKAVTPGSAEFEPPITAIRIVARLPGSAKWLIPDGNHPGETTDESGGKDNSSSSSGVPVERFERRATSPIRFNEDIMGSVQKKGYSLRRPRQGLAGTSSLDSGKKELADYMVQVERHHHKMEQIEKRALKREHEVYLHQLHRERLQNAFA